MRLASMLSVLGLVMVLARPLTADPLTEAPQRISEFKNDLTKYKERLKAANFANPAKRAEFEKDLSAFRESFDNFVKYVGELENGELAEKALAGSAKDQVVKGYVQLTEAAMAGCDYQLVQDLVLASKDLIEKSDKPKMGYWNAMALVRSIRFKDAEAACQDLGRAGGAKQAAQVMGLLKDQTIDIKTGKPMPSFGFRGVAGEKVAVPEASTGRVLLVDFWATWCGPCKAEMPNVIALYTELHEQGFDIIGISLDTEIESLKKYVEDNKMPWPQYFDGLKWDNRIAKYFNVTGIPRTVLLDRAGKVVATDLRGEELAKKVRELIAAKK